MALQTVLFIANCFCSPAVKNRRQPRGVQRPEGLFSLLINENEAESPALTGGRRVVCAAVSLGYQTESRTSEIPMHGVNKTEAGKHSGRERVGGSFLSLFGTPGNSPKLGPSKKKSFLPQNYDSVPH